MWLPVAVSIELDDSGSLTDEPPPRPGGQMLSVTKRIESLLSALAWPGLKKQMQRYDIVQHLKTGTEEG